MKKSQSINVIIGNKPIGQLRFESNIKKQHSQFEYDSDWIKGANSFALSPTLPLQEGSFFSVSKENDIRTALSGCFADSAPDTWGRRLLARSSGRELNEFDYLVLSDDQTRQGALRFFNEEKPLSSNPMPKLVNLKHFRNLVQKYERSEDSQKEAGILSKASGTLGGTRPKINILEDRHLWIAKFTSGKDTKPVERIEVATLNLAKQCGLNVAESKLELKNSKYPIALIKRFDRQGEKRIPYISAKTALEGKPPENRCYTDIADVIRKISGNPLSDLKELWRRIVFTILVSNSDDHLKNHGFLYINGHWQLSPAFDINPSPDRHRVLKTAIYSDLFDASLKTVLEASVFFDQSEESAFKDIKNMADVISNNWKTSLQNEGVCQDDIKKFAPAFQHEEIEMAIDLKRSGIK